MVLTLIILYVITLIYLSTVERFRNYASIIAWQGWILLGIALLQLHTLNWVELGFVILDTSGSSQFNSQMLSITALIISAITTYYVADSSVHMLFFGVALYALLSGLILIVLRSRIFTHVVGFLVIENGVFLFSMAIGVEMPILINMAIMLDILISILMLGMFLTKVDNKIHADDSDSLTRVKD